MRLVSTLLALFGAIFLVSGPATAQSVTFSGSGTVTSAAGRLPSTGLVPIDSPLQFSFDFDPSTASLVQSDVGYALYDLPVANFSATLGSFAFPLSSDPALVPFIELSRGFSFFGGSSSEPSIGFTFGLLGTPTGAATTPFGGSNGRSQQLLLGGVVRADGSDDLPTLADVLSAGQVFYQNFEYGTSDRALRQAGLLNGDYTGRFAVAAAVPEPTSWALMILGFGLIGAGIRRRRDGALSLA